MHAAFDWHSLEGHKRVRQRLIEIVGKRPSPMNELHKEVDGVNATQRSAASEMNIEIHIRQQRCYTLCKYNQISLALFGRTFMVDFCLNLPELKKASLKLLMQS